MYSKFYRIGSWVSGKYLFCLDRPKSFSNPENDDTFGRYDPLFVCCDNILKCSFLYFKSRLVFFAALKP